MRIGLWRWAVGAAVLVPVGAVAQPPPGGPRAPAPFPTPAEKPDPAVERARLQAEILAALKRLSVTPAPTTGPSGPFVAPKPKVEPAGPSKEIDRIRAGMNQFRDGDFDAARLTFQSIDPTTLPREERGFVRYMLACSWRRLNRPAEAEVIYREVANSGDDEFLATCAVHQLSLLKSEQELQSQLEQLRARAKSK